MLTFFRRIRKGLLVAGATRKYLVYAIGEILLVMIGILLALQVNNWNEWRKDNQKGRKYIYTIFQNLIRDSTVIHGHIQGFQDQYISVEKALTVYELSDKSGVDSLSFINNVYSAPAIIIVDRPKSLWDDLLSSGKTDMLRDEQLVELLEDYYLKYDNRINNYNEFPRVTRHEIRKILNESSDLSQIQGVVFIRNRSKYEVLSKQQFESLIINDQISRRLTGIMRSSKWHVITFSDQLSQIKVILSYLRESQ